MLKYKTETVHKIEYHNLEQFVKKVYNAKNYDFVSIQEGNNDSQYEFHPNGEIDDYEKENANLIREGLITTYQNRLLFNCLVADGYLPAGTYIVEVSW